jgi:hypothetical protein
VLSWLYRWGRLPKHRTRRLLRVRLGLRDCVALSTDRPIFVRAYPTPCTLKERGRRRAHDLARFSIAVAGSYSLMMDWSDRHCRVTRRLMRRCARPCRDGGISRRPSGPTAWCPRSPAIASVFPNGIRRDRPSSWPRRRFVLLARGFGLFSAIATPRELNALSVSRLRVQERKAAGPSRPCRPSKSSPHLAALSSSAPALPTPRYGPRAYPSWDR